jgi:flagellar biosynthesis protein FliP
MTLSQSTRRFAALALLFVAFTAVAAAEGGAAAPDSLPGGLAGSGDIGGASADLSPYGVLTSPGSSDSPIVLQATPPARPNNGGLQIQGLPGANVPWSIVIMLTALTLIPSILLCVTPFARLLIVFHFLRQALGLQTTPSNQTLIGLSLILTFFLMQPVGAQIFKTAIVPMQEGQITTMDAVKIGQAPLRKFMIHYVREKDVALFIDLAKEPRPATPDDLSMRVLLPAYILSELKAGFQIGTVLFLPFLIVDMVVASITTSIGMLQLPPVVISTPLKLLLFLMVDGWHLLIGSLMRSFS